MRLVVLIQKQSLAMVTTTFLPTTLMSSRLFLLPLVQLLSLWLPTGEAMVEDLKERSLLLAGCCCLRLTCYMLVSLCKKRACGHLWLTCWVVESDSPTCLQQQMQHSTCHMHKCSSTSCKQFVLKKSIVFVFFN